MVPRTELRTPPGRHMVTVPNVKLERNQFLSVNLALMHLTFQRLL